MDETDAQLERIATALEKIVDALESLVVLEADTRLGGTTLEREMVMDGWAGTRQTLIEKGWVRG